MWCMNLKHVICINFIKYHCQVKDLSLAGALDFHMGLSRRKVSISSNEWGLT